MSEVEKQSENTAPVEESAAQAEAKAAPVEQPAAPAEKPAASDGKKKSNTKIRIIVELSLLVVALVVMCIVGEVKCLKWWCHMRASLGSAKMQYELGKIYDRENRREDAKRWLRKAADQGHSEAALLLVESAPTNAEKIKLLLPAAEKGAPEVQYKLANLYRIEKKMDEAVKWYEKAARKEHAAAMHALGVCYLDGNGVKKDLKKAEEWLQKAKAKGNVHSEEKLKDVDKSKANYEKIEQLLPAAEKGDAKVQYELAGIYEQEMEDDNAFKWYEKAAQNGYVNAIFSLGICYWNGRGVKLDAKKGKALLLKAKAKGHKGAVKLLKEIEKEEAAAR